MDGWRRDSLLKNWGRGQRRKIVARTVKLLMLTDVLVGRFRSRVWKVPVPNKRAKG